MRQAGGVFGRYRKLVYRSQIFRRFQNSIHMLEGFEGKPLLGTEEEVLGVLQGHSVRRIE